MIPLGAVSEREMNNQMVIFSTDPRSAIPGAIREFICRRQRGYSILVLGHQAAAAASCCNHDNNKQLVSVSQALSY